MDTVAQTMDASSRCVCEWSRFYALKFARPACRPWALSHGGISYVVVLRDRLAVSKREKMKAFQYKVVGHTIFDASVVEVCI